MMHNQPGPDWDAWNRKMRRRLIDTQCKDGCCATGSWDPQHDHWGSRGGRVMQTSLSALTLEVYYRYLPLYKLDRESASRKPLREARPRPTAGRETRRRQAGRIAVGRQPASCLHEIGLPFCIIGWILIVAAPGGGCGLAPRIRPCRFCTPCRSTAMATWRSST